jgi:8-oxo-dGTP pyrophosphatase MutT (NUDIX family)
MNKNFNVCKNCRKTGHFFHQCKLPITSYGVIVFRESQNGIEYLMIRRKNSFGFIDFIRGKYTLENIFQLQKIIDEMSIEEKEKILTLSFEDLLKDMWDDDCSLHLKNEEALSRKKLNQIREGIITGNEECIQLKDLVERSATDWKETEWEFPKGKRNMQESDMECALREFQEETGIFFDRIKIIENVLPFEETFIGTNHKSYKHKYFLAHMQYTEEILDNFQTSEVSQIEWKNIDKCLQDIRPYNFEKKQIIININKVLQEYRLYS